VKRMPYDDANAGVTRRNTSHSRHARDGLMDAARGRPSCRAVPVILANHGRMVLASVICSVRWRL
jgi:hypothetical protein